MHRRSELSRRELAALLVALPAAPALARAEEKAAERASPLAEFLAAREPGLSAAEREALKKSVSGAEKGLQVIRDFALPPDVAPAVRFAALKSKRR
jgi:hypothetical protein